MKKLILLLFLGIIFTAASAYAMGSPQSTNPNEPNYVPPPTSAASGTAAAGAESTPSTTAGKGFITQFKQVYSMGNAIAAAGPKLAGRLANVSGKLFAYLAVISLILWSIQNLMFGDKGVKEFFLYFFFLMVVKGLLAEYNFFFVQGVANFFADLGRIVAGTSLGTPMQRFGTLAQNIYIDMLKINVGSAASLNPITMASTAIANNLTFLFATLLIIVLALIILGTITLIQIYVAIALIVGYIFVPFMIFKPLEFLWNGWLKFLITSCLSYFLIYLMTALMQSTINSLADSTLSFSGAGWSTIWGFMFLLAIFAYLFLKIPSIAGEIVSGMPNMSFSGVTSVVIGAASVMLAGGRIAGTALKTGAQIMNKAKGGGDK